MRLLTLEMLENAQYKPCKSGLEKFKQLFGTQVHVTEDLCVRYHHVFRPWGAIAYILLSQKLYQQHWRELSYGHSEQTAALFAKLFNQEGNSQ